MSDDISPNQLRAARSMIGWTREDLADASGATTRNLARIEAGEIKPRPRTVAAIRSALEAAGVEFIPENGGGAGVRLRKETR
jgi:predicted transcriptional regulator